MKIRSEQILKCHKSWNCAIFTESHINKYYISGLANLFSMATKKHLIHYLLAFCIGLLPVLNASAMHVEHSASAPLSCIDCEPGEKKLDDSCDDKACSSITQSCGSHSCASYLPAAPSVEGMSFAQINSPGRYDPDCRQGVTDQIYRPPIA